MGKQRPKIRVGAIGRVVTGLDPVGDVIVDGVTYSARLEGGGTLPENVSIVVSDFVQDKLIVCEASPKRLAVLEVRIGRQPANFRKATRRIRLAARLIDAFIYLLVLVPGIVVAGMVIEGNATVIREAVGGWTMYWALDIAVAVSGVTLLLLYNIYLLTMRGQTIGKRLLRIRIIGLENGDNPGFAKCVLIRNGVTTLLSLVPYLGPLFSGVNFLFIFGSEKRCLHDYLASTRVVEVECIVSTDDDIRQDKTKRSPISFNEEDSDYRFDQ